MSGAPALSEKLSANLAANGIAALNPLQLSALDAGMRGLDMIVHAETGSADRHSTRHPHRNFLFLPLQ